MADMSHFFNCYCNGFYKYIGIRKKVGHFKKLNKLDIFFIYRPK